MSAAPATYFRMTLREFLRTAFVGRPPTRNTLKAIIDRGDWLGERVCKSYFIFVDERGQPIPGKPRPPQTGNADADALLLEWDQSRR